MKIVQENQENAITKFMHDMLKCLLWKTLKEVKPQDLVQNNLRRKVNFSLNNLNPTKKTQKPPKTHGMWR